MWLDWKLVRARCSPHAVAWNRTLPTVSLLSPKNTPHLYFRFSQLFFLIFSTFPLLIPSVSAVRRLSMASEIPVPLNDDVNVVKEKPVNRSSPTKKNPGKVPGKIHKAEREKLKRDNLNVLFMELSRSLEPVHQNNGKASILTDSARLLRELVTQVDHLRRENSTLLSESHYVAAEKNELREDNVALEAQIEKLQSEIDERVHSNSSWNLDDSQTQAHVPGHVLVVPLHHDLEAYHNPDAADTLSKFPKNVSKPLPRYPSPSDSWPSQILSKQPETTPTALHSSSTNSKY